MMWMKELILDILKEVEGLTVTEYYVAGKGTIFIGFDRALTIFERDALTGLGLKLLRASRTEHRHRYWVQHLVLDFFFYEDEP